MRIAYPSSLTDREWTCLQRYLPHLLTRRRWRRHSLRAVLDAIFSLLHTGCPWRYLLADFPPWQTVYYHFRRFRLSGVWSLLLTALRRAERERVGRDPQPSAAIMDAQSVKSVEESICNSGYDGHKRIKGRKRHRLVATLGLPLSIEVTSADAHDTTGAWRLLAGLAPLVPRLKKIWGGGWGNAPSPGWCATAVCASITSTGCRRARHSSKSHSSACCSDGA